MKNLILALSLFVTFNALASESFKCTSEQGSITVTELQDGLIKLDLKKFEYLGQSPAFFMHDLFDAATSEEEISVRYKHFADFATYNVLIDLDKVSLKAKLSIKRTSFGLFRDYKEKFSFDCKKI